MTFVRQICVMALFAGALVLPGAAQEQSPAPLKLLDHLAGNWVMKGTIRHQQTTHDVEARWVLRREYLELHEISREKNVKGQPAYEAIILISWDARANQYACLWLDSTAGGGLTTDTICRAKPAEHSIPFVFSSAGEDQIHTTFNYQVRSDSWEWLIDNVENGLAKPFARLTLTRAH